MTHEELFPQDIIDAVNQFYSEYEPVRALENYRTIKAQVGKVKNIFFGDSITAGWPVKEFFPSHSVLNRGIGGDNVVGLHTRLEGDVFYYQPERVFMIIGINGIQWDEDLHVERICHVAADIMNQGIQLWLGSILPLRYPDKWNRFQYQDRIVSINQKLRDWANANGANFLDYHAALRDETGQLGEKFAKPDGTHATFAAYVKMAEVVAPFLA